MRAVRVVEGIGEQTEHDEAKARKAAAGRASARVRQRWCDAIQEMRVGGAGRQEAQQESSGSGRAASNFAVSAAESHVLYG